MKQVMKWVAVIVASAFACALIWLCWVWYRTAACERAYARVQIGDSQARVAELWGPPGYISADLKTNLSWEASSHLYYTNGRCVRQFHYFPPFSICGESWEIGFDDRSNVVSKFHVVSP